MSTLPPDANEPQGAQQPEQPATPPVPPAAPQYEAPPAGAYQAPQQPGYQQPVTDPVSNLQLNYWLSVFFAWIPALIFWIIEKDKGDRRAVEFHVANLNFSLLRTIVGVGASVLAAIPYIGWLIAAVLWIGGIVLFVFHIIAATKVANEYRGGGKTDPFAFNLPLVK